VALENDKISKAGTSLLGPDYLPSGWPAHDRSRSHTGRSRCYVLEDPWA
jgi:hypothetical protein